MPEEEKLLLGLFGAFTAGVCVAAGLWLSTASLSAARTGGQATDLAALKARFGRPRTVPFPASNPYSEAKRALGERLFNDPTLSAAGTLACASCHRRELGLADGRARGLSAHGRPLARHTPTLWNLAWAGPVFWDGRARSLEEQVLSPIENADEMGQPISALVKRLAADPSYRNAFRAAFPDDPRVTPENLQKAIATFERTLVSPPTRFDRWVEGDERALTAQEIDGFRLFAGKAGCANCHSGFAFTDYAFHDIGLPGEDRGRGAVLRLPAADYAFKTPTLREIERSAPYMHDGSLQTLGDVLRHYESGIVERPTLSRDLPRRLQLSEAERGALVAFLKTLTSEGSPRLPRRIAPAPAAQDIAPVRTHTVAQDEKRFLPPHVTIGKGERLWIINNDSRTHNVRVFEDTFEFDSGAQEPGETIEVGFPNTGSFLVFCGIHPKMELHVEVRP